MNNLCIIPARGGSKRIPRKNIRDFFGKPVMSYAIETAIESALFSEVMVSTDDDEIKNIALSYGAFVPFMRSMKNSNDHATTFDVIQEVLLTYKKLGKDFDYVCCLYPCTPLNTVSNMQTAFQLLLEKRFETVFTISQYSTPIYRALKVEDNYVLPIFPSNELIRSQDLAKAYYDAGQFYWMNVDRLLLNKKMISDVSGFIELDELQIQDIDNESDWEMAKFKYLIFNSDKHH